MIFAASMLVCQSCSDFLKEKNPVGRQNIYETESDLEAAVEGVLSGFAFPDSLSSRLSIPTGGSDLNATCLTPLPSTISHSRNIASPTT